MVRVFTNIPKRDIWITPATHDYKSQSFTETTKTDLWAGLVNDQNVRMTSSDIPALSEILMWTDGTPILPKSDWFPNVDIKNGSYCLRMHQNGTIEAIGCNSNLAYVCQFDCNNPTGNIQSLKQMGTCAFLNGTLGNQICPFFYIGDLRINATETLGV